VADAHKCIYWRDARHVLPGVNAILSLLVIGVVIVERDHPVQDCKPGDIRRVTQPESLHQFASMFLDGLDADSELLCDLLVQVTECDEPGYLTHADRHWWFF